MYARDIINAAVVASAATDCIPISPCWQTCFDKYQADADLICSNSVDNVVSACINAGCVTVDATIDVVPYATWLESYCSVEVEPPVSHTELASISSISHHTASEANIGIIASYTATSSATSNTLGYPSSGTTYETTRVLTSYVPCTTEITSGTATFTTTYETTSIYTISYNVTKTPVYNTWMINSTAVSPSVPASTTPTSTPYVVTNGSVILSTTPVMTTIPTYSVTKNVIPPAGTMEIFTGTAISVRASTLTVLFVGLVLSLI